MKTRLMFTTAALAMVLAAPCAAAQQKAAQQAVPVDQLPAAVTASVAKSYPGSTIVSAAKMSRGKQVRYELSVKPSADAAPVALMVSPEGLISTGGKPAAGAAAAAQPFPVVDLPKAVVKAIKDAYPKDTIIAALKSASGSKVLYELTLTDVSSVAPLHVIVTEDGQIQKR
jgi:hypothetical protein